MQTNNSWPITLLEVTGADASSFLQGQLTCDVTGLTADTLSLGAWCNPKGRVIALFRLRKFDEGFALFLPSDLAEAVLQRLTMFRFRAKVEFNTRPAAPAELAQTGEVHYADWAARNVADGIAEIRSAESEKFTPHMLNLDLLAAISLDKGCYTGQEVVARTHYRGATRRRLLKFAVSGSADPGDKVQLDGRDVGEVVNTAANRLLAVVPVDSAEAGLTVNGNPLTHEPLPYLGEQS